MKFPKLVIASNGKRTFVVLDGVAIGRGIERLEFVAGKDDQPTIRILDIDVYTAEVETDSTAVMKMLEAIAKE